MQLKGKCVSHLEKCHRKDCSIAALNYKLERKRGVEANSNLILEDEKK